jgi:hypothetical protein
MKKFLVPSLLALFAVGLSQREANAGFSIDISIGDSHRHRPPVIVARPPVVVARPPVVVVPARPQYCERGHVYVRECEHHHHRPDWRRHGYDRHDRYDRYERRDHRDYRHR